MKQLQARDAKINKLEKIGPFFGLNKWIHYININIII